MANDGTSFQIDLPVTGAEGVRSAADQMDLLASRLTAASAAATNASAAVKSGEVAYKQAEASYDRAAKSLERIDVAMQSASGKTLANLIARQGEAAQAVVSSKTALDGEATALDRLRTSASAADKEVESLTQAQAAAKKSLDASKKSQADSMAANELLASSLGKLGGPLGAVGQKAFELRGAWDKMGKALGAAGPYLAVSVAFVAIAAGVIAVGAAAVAGVAQIGAWAVGLADAARTQGLLAAGIARSVDGGRELDAAIDSLSRRVPQTSEELTSMAAELAKTGLRGKALTDTLETNATAAAKLKFGPEWQSQMISLEQSQKRLKSGLNGLFSGLKIDALLEGLSTLVDTFDEGSASGQAIKVVFESLFQPLVDGAAGMVPKIRHAFLQFEILALKALIAIKPWGSTILKVGEVIAVVGAVMLGVFAVAIGVVVGLCGALVASIVAPIALFAALAAGVVYLSSVVIGLGVDLVNGIVGGLQSAWTAASNFGAQILAVLSNVSLVDAGAQIIAGLVAGITGGATAAVDAVSNVATSVIGAAKTALGIASPSKVFAEIGAYTAQGMEQGIEGSSGSVESAMSDLATPTTPSAGAASGGAQAPSGGNTYTFVFQGGASPSDDIVEKVRQIILDTVEGAVIQLGTAVPG